MTTPQYGELDTKEAEREAVRLRPFDNNIIKGKTCISATKGDGEYDKINQRWIQYPCDAMTCPRHWRRYAKQQYAKRANDLTGRTRWFHVRLSTKVFMMQGKRYQSLPLFLTKLKKEYPESKTVGVWHRNTKGDHVHLAIGLDQPLEKDKVRGIWQAHFPAKTTTPFRNSYVYVSQEKSGKGVFWYALLGSRTQPRRSAPWSGMPCKSPVVTKGISP